MTDIAHHGIDLRQSYPHGFHDKMLQKIDMKINEPGGWYMWAANCEHVFSRVVARSLPPKAVRDDVAISLLRFLSRRLRGRNDKYKYAVCCGMVDRDMWRASFGITG